MSKSYRLENDLIKKVEEKRLHEQAMCLFNIEISKIQELFSEKINRIVDLGAGNGSYLFNLGNTFHAKELLAIDHNVYLMEQGKQRFPSVNFIESDLIGFVQNLDFRDSTLFVIRFVLQHLSQDYIVELFETLTKMHPKSFLLVIDVDETGFINQNSNAKISQLHENLIKIQHSNGGNRYIGNELPKIINKMELKLIGMSELRYSLSNLSLENFKNIFLTMLLLNAQSLKLEKLSEEEKTEMVEGVAFLSKIFVLEL